MAYKINNKDVNIWSNEYEGEPFHALFCDSPYHLTTITKRFGKEKSVPAKFGKDGAFGRVAKGFMGQEWDGGDVAFRPETWEGLGKHLYPGAFGMTFGGSRTAHRMACAIEDAGFIIHPMIGYVYGSGFPKATSVSRAVDSMELYGKTDTRSKRKADYENNTGEEIEVVQGNAGFANDVQLRKRKSGVTPATEMGKAWEGHRYGLQALKPAMEPIIVFQKPFEGRPIENILENGAGALNIDGGRIPLEQGETYNINRFDDGMKPFGNGAGHAYTPTRRMCGNTETDGGVSSYKTGKRKFTETQEGRWPANFIIDDTVSPILDAKTGVLKSGKMSPEVSKRSTAGSPNGIYGKFDINSPLTETYGDSGGASRFFFNVGTALDDADPFVYEKKASQKERKAGMGEDVNTHPTLKSISLTTYLSKLLLPPVEYADRRLLVPFSGVASEMIGGLLAGWEYVEGIELTPEYVPIAYKRLEYWVK